MNLFSQYQSIQLLIFYKDDQEFVANSDYVFDIDKIYLYTKDPYEAKYQFLVNKRGSTGLRYFVDS